MPKPEDSDFDFMSYIDRAEQDDTAYSPFAVYAQARDSNSEKKSLTLDIPLSTWPRMMQAMESEFSARRYRSVQDLVRDAVIHRLAMIERLTKEIAAKDGDLEPWTHRYHAMYKAMLAYDSLEAAGANAQFERERGKQELDRGKKLWEDFSSGGQKTAFYEYFDQLELNVNYFRDRSREEMEELIRTIRLGMEAKGILGEYEAWRLNQQN